MKQIPPAYLEFLLQQCDQLLEPVGIEWHGVQQKEGDLPHHIPRSIPRQNRVGFHGLQDLHRIVMENQSEKLTKPASIRSVRTKESGSPLTKCNRLGRRITREPPTLVENGQHILRGKKVFSGWMGLHVP